MNITDIIKKAYSAPMLCQIFAGTFLCDNISAIKKLPYAAVVNLDASNLPGSHWVAVYFLENGQCEYFDNYGRKPLGYISKYISNYCTSYTYNNMRSHYNPKGLRQIYFIS